MNDIAEKSVGMLLDELITTIIKLHHFRAAAASDQTIVARLAQRRSDLAVAVERRVARQSSLDQPQAAAAVAAGSALGSLITELTETLISCWEAQERVMQSEDPSIVAPAAKAAQQLNAKRNKLLQAIDAALGQTSISVTGKTYG